MPASSWLISTITGGGLTVAVQDAGGVNGSVNVPLPAGPLYLFDATGALSYADTLAADILAQNSDVTFVSIELLQNRHSRFIFEATGNVSLTWGSATDLRDAFGFAGNMSGGTEYVSENPCDLVWCPGLTEISSARLGRPGTPVYDVQVSGPPGSTRINVTSHHYREVNTLQWRNVDNGRVWVDETGGEHIVWWRKVVIGGRQFAHYRQITNDEDSTTAVTLATRVGPYQAVPPSPAMYTYDRVVENVEFRQNVSMDVVVVDELS